MIALIIVNLVWTGVALYVNYSWRKTVHDTFGEFLEDEENEQS